MLQLIGKQQLEQDAARAKLPLVDYIYREVMKSTIKTSSRRDYTIADATRAVNCYLFERKWIKIGKPYYNLFPAIITPLLRIKLDKVKTTAIKPPVESLAIRFPAERNPVVMTPKSGPFVGQALQLHSLLLGVAQPDLDKNFKVRATPANHRTCGLMAQFNIDPQERAIGVCVIPNTMPLANEGDRKISEELATCDWAEGDLVVEDVIKLFKLAFAVCLLSTDANDNIVIPDVLTDDRRRYEETRSQHLVDRARRRGKLGWNIGEVLDEQMLRPKLPAGEGHKIGPHFRGPSPIALYWTGPGSSIPVLQYRQGCIVHEDQLRKMPTGYQEQ
jgi:hypothetical protein